MTNNPASLLAGLVLLSLSLPTHAGPDTQTHTGEKRFNTQQNLFLETYDALKKNEPVDDSTLKALKSYPLYPYIAYQLLAKKINSASEQELEKYMGRYPNSHLADKLKTVWLGRKVMRKQWRSVVDFHRPDKGGITARCYFLEAKIQLALDHKSSQLNDFLNQAKSLWMSGKRRPSACNSLFDLLKQKGRLDDQAYWQRIGLIIQAGNTRLAGELARHTTESTQSLVSLWLKLRRDPEKYLDDALLEPSSSESTEIRQTASHQQTEQRKSELIAYAIKRIARKNTAKARSKWRNVQPQYPFSAARKGDVESYLGYREALDHHPHALRRLAAIPAEFRSEDANLWLARMAIRSGDWKKYRHAYQAMNTENQGKDIWRYWEAHALKRTGKKQARQKADQLLTALADDASFYGFLAADQMKLPYRRLVEPDKDWSRCRNKIVNLESIQRAVEWYAIGKPALARKEWFWTLDHLNKEGKLVAAEYARHIGQPFLSILTVSKTRDWNQVGLRFPLEYRLLVEASAKEHRISPAWVYGIMRRESAFDHKIVSSARAQGLMQVLPSTAKGVAKKLGISDHKKSDLLIPEKNARIGSAYLSGLLKRFRGNYSKATAAYNAGPGRVVKWAPDFHIAAPRWIESIPFTETRKYVRAVLSYTTIYDHKLHHKKGTNLRLTKRLRPIGPH